MQKPSGKEVEDCKDKRHNLMMHAPVPRLKFQALNFGRLEKDFLCDLIRYHGGQLPSDMEAMPYSTQVIEIEFSRLW
jgi:hypothetical protein